MSKTVQQIVLLDISKIKPNPDNSKIFSMTKIDNLAESIKEDGFSGAIEVCEIGDGFYEILSGHRRFEAVKKNKQKQIQAIVYPKMDESEKAKKLIMSNLNSRELTSMDKARALHYYSEHVLTDKKIDKNGECAKVVGISKTQVKYLKMLTSYALPLQKLIEDDKIEYTGLIGIKSKLNEKQQCTLADEIEKKYIEAKDAEAIKQGQNVDDISFTLPYTIVKAIANNYINSITRERQRTEKLKETPEERKNPVGSKIFSGETSNMKMFEPDYALIKDGEVIAHIETNTSYQPTAEDELVKAISCLERALTYEVKFGLNEYISRIEQILYKLKKK